MDDHDFESRKGGDQPKDDLFSIVPEFASIDDILDEVDVDTLLDRAALEGEARDQAGDRIRDMKRARFRELQSQLREIYTRLDQLQFPEATRLLVVLDGKIRMMKNDLERLRTDGGWARTGYGRYGLRSPDLIQSFIDRCEREAADAEQPARGTMVNDGTRQLFPAWARATEDLTNLREELAFVKRIASMDSPEPPAQPYGQGDPRLRVLEVERERLQEKEEESRRERTKLEEEKKKKEGIIYDTWSFLGGEEDERWDAPSVKGNVRAKLVNQDPYDISL